MEARTIAKIPPAEQSPLPPHAVVMIFGVIDSLVPFSYLFDVYPYIYYWYAATLAIKLVLCAFYYKYLSISRITLLSVIALTAIILVSSVPGHSQLSDYIKIFGFVIHVFVTLTMIRRENLSRYVSTCVGVIFVSTLVYLAAARMGHIHVTFGRYSYFHGSHPNLGSEIIAMSIMLAACVLNWPLFLIVTLPSLYAIHLMEGRAAILVALITIAAKFFYSEWRHKTRLFAILALAATGAVAAVLLSNRAWTYLNSIFLFRDKYRGIGSGFVGRDQLWSVAWHWFLHSPIIGNGAGFFDRYGVEVHNYFLFGLSEFGLLSLAIYAMIFYLFYDLFRTDKKWFFSFIGIPVFWMFNDRFFNINPYPFLFYIVLFAHANSASLRMNPALLLRKSAQPPAAAA